LDEVPAGLKERLRQALERKRLTQREVARQLGGEDKYRNTVRGWLTGDTAVPVGFVLWVMSQTGADGHWLLTGQGQPERVEESEALRRLAVIRAAVEGLDVTTPATGGVREPTLAEQTMPQRSVAPQTHQESKPKKRRA
jgi:transcriptional regulator with XRE-family HTH domain